MKLITFVNYAYIPIVHNLYLQLKKINRHENLIVYCTDQETYVDLSNKLLNCEVILYKSLLFNDVINENQSHLNNKLYGGCHTQSVSFTIYQFLKQDAFYQTLLKHDRVCLFDSDIIVFEDFFDELIYWMDNTRRFMYGIPSDFGFKYYLNVKIDVNPNNKSYSWIGKEQIINSGFIYARRCDSTLKHIEEYCKLFRPHFGQKNNIEEHVLTEYFQYVNENTTSISDQINLVSNSGTIYTPQQVLKIKPMTFHPTFTHDKIQFTKECNQWFLE